MHAMALPFKDKYGNYNKKKLLKLDHNAALSKILGD